MEWIWFVSKPRSTARCEPATDEELRQGWVVPPHQHMELGEVGSVHGHVSLVDGDAEAPEDGAHGAAVLEGAVHGAEGGEVEHDAALPCRSVAAAAANDLHVCSLDADRARCRTILPGEPAPASGAASSRTALMP